MEVKSHARGGSVIEQLFGFEGRVRRSTFWVNSLVLGVIGLVVNYVMVDVSVSPYTLETQTSISNKPVFFLLTAVLALRGLSIHARRWHDMDKSGWWAAVGLFIGLASQLALGASYGTSVILTLLMGIVALVMLGFLGFVPGDKGENDYGPPPVAGQIL